MTASPVPQYTDRTTTLSDLPRIREALSCVSPDDRDVWLTMGMAVKSAIGEQGFDLWDDWSQGADSYSQTDARDVWRSIKANGNVTVGTLYHAARAQGWRDDGIYHKPTSEELAERKRMAAERAAQEEAKLARKREKAAKKAAATWKAATPAQSDNLYLARKGVGPTSTLREIETEQATDLLGYEPKSRGEPLTGPLLVAPVKVDDRLSTLELIDGSGRKHGIADGAKRNGYWASEQLPEGDGEGLRLVIGEGVATVLSVREVSGRPAVAALSSGNLLAVALIMRKRYSKAELTILADLVKTTGEADPHAIKAARAVSATLAVPDFGPDRPEGATDFNDMARHLGREAVREAIGGQAGVSRVSAGDAQTRANNDLHTDTRETHQKDVAYQTVPDPTDAPASGDDSSSLPKSGVSGVSRVQPPDDVGSSDAPSGLHGVSQVSGTRRSQIPDTPDRPAFRVFDDWIEHGGTKYRPGVWFFATDKDGELVQTWVCSPLYVEAVTFDAQDNNFGRLLRFKTTLGRWREWAMPMELLSGLGNEVRAELLATGVEIDPSTKARNLLSTYLQSRPPKRRMRCALQIGWCDGSFVLPDTVIGPAASRIIFQSGERGHDEHTVAGTLDGWRAEIADRAIDNPLLTLALSSGFAGPLLARTNSEGGGIHLVGDSSTGKTTIIEAACSTWGGPNYRRSWRATANGLEGAAALFNDGLLALDEISECSPRDVGAIVYALGNGRGKQRASRTGTARGVVRWRCVILSSGERTIVTAMHEGGQRAKAGQTVRLLDIPVARAYGAWDTLHGAANAASFSDAIKRASVTHHGHAGRAFLERLTHDRRDFCPLLDEVKSLPIFDADRAEGQDTRAAARFALIALAGELATEYRLTGWPEGAAIQASATGFELWRSLRGSGNDERRQLREQVAAFIERHGDSRFSNADGDNNGKVYERAGWWRDTQEGRDYLFNADGMREALKGFDFRRGLDVLQEVGALAPPKADGKRSRFYRIGGRGVKLYPINHDKLGDSYA